MEAHHVTIARQAVQARPAMSSCISRTINLGQRGKSPA